MLDHRFVDELKNGVKGKHVKEKDVKGKFIKIGRKNKKTKPRRKR